MKSFIEIRPVNHRKDKRIRAHVFVCVLSLLLSSIMEEKTGMTISRTIESLSEMKAVPVVVPGGNLLIRSRSEKAERVLSTFNIPIPKKVIGDTPEKQ